VTYQLQFGGQIVGTSDIGIFVIDRVGCEDAGMYTIHIYNDVHMLTAVCDVIIEPCGEGEMPEGEDWEGEPQEGEPWEGPCKIWTSGEDFDEGYGFNLEPVEEDGDFCLQLSENTIAWPYIAIANSGRNTVTRAEVNTGNVVGEYLTRPNGMGGNPSRTTVDAYGNAWVGNRDESSNAMGSVTRIGLLVGGTRVDAGGNPDPNGDYVQNPSYCTCEDRDFDGLIKTSQGYPWGNGTSDWTPTSLSWSNAGSADTNGGVSTAEDECITAYVRVAGTKVRFVAVDPFGDVWTGSATDRLFQKINAATATAVSSSIFNSICGGYGGLVDGDNVIWSANWDPGNGSGFMRYDVNFPSAPLTCISNIQNYGVGIDPDTCHIWTTSAYYDNNLREVDQAGNLLNVYNHFGASSPVDLTRGVVVSNGSVWVAHGNSNTIGRVTTAGVHLGNIPVGALPTGVAADTNGKIWSTNLGSNNASRIDPSTIPGSVDLTVDLGFGASPYNYSDMTGSVLLQAIAPQGSWTTTFDSGILGYTWTTLSWLAYQDPGTTITVKVRAGDSPNPAGPWTTISNNIPFTGVAGRYIQIQVTLTRPPYCYGKAQVRLCDLKLCGTQGCMTLAILEKKCDPETGDITTVIQVTNNSGMPASTVLLTPQTPNVIITPNVIQTPIPVGATVPLNVIISGAIPGALTCFTVTLGDMNKMECCSQTVCLRFDCDGCLEFLNERIECDPDQSGTFLYTFQVKNRTAVPMHHLYVYPPAGTTMTNYVNFVPPLAPSMISSPITLSVTTNQVPGSLLCFDYSAHDRFLNTCCEGWNCLRVPDCPGMGEGEGEGDPCSGMLCDDGDLCTEDFCDPATGGCFYVSIPGCEGEGEPREGEGEPQEGEPQEGEGPCQSNADCDDGNPCTEDFCDPATGGCFYVPIPGCEGEGEPREGEGEPQEGEPQEGEGPCQSNADCGDGNPCTEDFCDPATGGCVHLPIAGCEGEGEPREGEGEPQEGEPQEGEGPCQSNADCDDGNPCTEDFCDPVSGRCLYLSLADCEGEGESGNEGEPHDFHPGDLNNDSRMVLGEAIAYLNGWQQGSNPIGYAIRATYLWQNGENYTREPGVEPPMCWVLATAKGLKSIAPSGKMGSAVRSMDEGNTIITVTPNPGTTVWGVEQPLPEGMSAVEVTGVNGQWDAIHHKVTWWGTGAAPAVLGFKTTGVPGAYVMSGVVSFDGALATLVNPDEIHLADAPTDDTDSSDAHSDTTLETPDNGENNMEDEASESGTAEPEDPASPGQDEAVVTPSGPNDAPVPVNVTEITNAAEEAGSCTGCFRERLKTGTLFNAFNKIFADWLLFGFGLMVVLMLNFSGHRQ